MLETEDSCDIRIALGNLLGDFESGGSFATSGVYSEAPLPDLSLQGYGGIPLPLAQRDAEAICKERTEGELGKDSVGMWVAGLCAQRTPLQKPFL